MTKKKQSSRNKKANAKQDTLSDGDRGSKKNMSVNQGNKKNTSFDIANSSHKLQKQKIIVHINKKTKDGTIVSAIGTCDSKLSSSSIKGLGVKKIPLASKESSGSLNVIPVRRSLRLSSNDNAILESSYVKKSRVHKKQIKCKESDVCTERNVSRSQLSDFDDESNSPEKDYDEKNFINDINLDLENVVTIVHSPVKSADNAKTKDLQNSVIENINEASDSGDDDVIWVSSDLNTTKRHRLSSRFIPPAHCELTNVFIDLSEDQIISTIRQVSPIIISDDENNIDNDILKNNSTKPDSSSFNLVASNNETKGDISEKSNNLDCSTFGVLRNEVDDVSNKNECDNVNNDVFMDNSIVLCPGSSDESVEYSKEIVLKRKTLLKKRIVISSSDSPSDTEEIGLDTLSQTFCSFNKLPEKECINFQSENLGGRFEVKSSESSIDNTLTNNNFGFNYPYYDECLISANNETSLPGSNVSHKLDDQKVSEVSIDSDSLKLSSNNIYKSNDMLSQTEKMDVSRNNSNKLVEENISLSLRHGPLLEDCTKNGKLVVLSKQLTTDFEKNVLEKTPIDSKNSDNDKEVMISQYTCRDEIDNYPSHWKPQKRQSCDFLSENVPPDSYVKDTFFEKNKSSSSKKQEILTPSSNKKQINKKSKGKIKKPIKNESFSAIKVKTNSKKRKVNSFHPDLKNEENKILNKASFDIHEENLLVKKRRKVVSREILSSDDSDSSKELDNKLVQQSPRKKKKLEIACIEKNHTKDPQIIKVVEDKFKSPSLANSDIIKDTKMDESLKAKKINKLSPSHIQKSIGLQFTASKDEKDFSLEPLNSTKELKKTDPPSDIKKTSLKKEKINDKSNEENLKSVDKCIRNKHLTKEGGTKEKKSTAKKNLNDTKSDVSTNSMNMSSKEIDQLANNTIPTIKGPKKCKAMSINENLGIETSGEIKLSLKEGYRNSSKNKNNRDSDEKCITPPRKTKSTKNKYKRKEENFENKETKEKSSNRAKNENITSRPKHEKRNKICKTQLFKPNLSEEEISTPGKINNCIYDKKISSSKRMEEIDRRESTNLKDKKMSSYQINYKKRSRSKSVEKNDGKKNKVTSRICPENNKDHHSKNNELRSSGVNVKKMRDNKDSFSSDTLKLNSVNALSENTNSSRKEGDCQMTKDKDENLDNMFQNSVSENLRTPCLNVNKKQFSTSKTDVQDTNSIIPDRITQTDFNVLKNNVREGLHLKDVSHSPVSSDCTKGKCETTMKLNNLIDPSKSITDTRTADYIHKDSFKAQSHIKLKSNQVSTSNRSLIENQPPTHKLSPIRDNISRDFGFFNTENILKNSTGLKKPDIELNGNNSSVVSNVVDDKLCKEDVKNQKKNAILNSKIIITKESTHESVMHNEHYCKEKIGFLVEPVIIDDIPMFRYSPRLNRSSEIFFDIISLTKNCDDVLSVESNEIHQTSLECEAKTNEIQNDGLDDHIKFFLPYCHQMLKYNKCEITNCPLTHKFDDNILKKDGFSSTWSNVVKLLHSSANHQIATDAFLAITNWLGLEGKRNKLLAVAMYLSSIDSEYTSHVYLSTCWLHLMDAYKKTNVNRINAAQIILQHITSHSPSLPNKVLQDAVKYMGLLQTDIEDVWTVIQVLKRNRDFDLPLEFFETLMFNTVKKPRPFNKNIQNVLCEFTDDFLKMNMKSLIAIDRDIVDAFSNYLISFKLHRQDIELQSLLRKLPSDSESHVDELKSISFIDSNDVRLGDSKISSVKISDVSCDITDEAEVAIQEIPKDTHSAVNFSLKQNPEKKSFFQCQSLRHGKNRSGVSEKITNFRVTDSFFEGKDRARTETVKTPKSSCLNAVSKHTSINQNNDPSSRSLDSLETPRNSRVHSFRYKQKCDGAIQSSLAVNARAVNEPPASIITPWEPQIQFSGLYPHLSSFKPENEQPILGVQNHSHTPGYINPKINKSNPLLNSSLRNNSKPFEKLPQTRSTYNQFSGNSNHSKPTAEVVHEKNESSLFFTEKNTSAYPTQHPNKVQEETSMLKGLADQCKTNYNDSRSLINSCERHQTMQKDGCLRIKWPNQFIQEDAVNSHKHLLNISHQFIEPLHQNTCNNLESKNSNKLDSTSKQGVNKRSLEEYRMRNHLNDKSHAINQEDVSPPAKLDNQKYSSSSGSRILSLPFPRLPDIDSSALDSRHENQIKRDKFTYNLSSNDLSNSNVQLPYSRGSKSSLNTYSNIIHDSSICQKSSHFREGSSQNHITTQRRPLTLEYFERNAEELLSEKRHREIFDLACEMSHNEQIMKHMAKRIMQAIKNSDTTLYYPIMKIFLQMMKQYGIHNYNLKCLFGTIATNKIVEDAKLESWLNAFDLYKIMQHSGFSDTLNERFNKEDGLSEVFMTILICEIFINNKIYNEAVKMILNNDLLIGPEHWGLKGDKQDKEKLWQTAEYILGAMHQDHFDDEELFDLFLKKIIESQKSLMHPINVTYFIEDVMAAYYDSDPDKNNMWLVNYYEFLRQYDLNNLSILSCRILMINFIKTRHYGIEEIYNKCIEREIYPALNGKENPLYIQTNWTKEEIWFILNKWFEIIAYNYYGDKTFSRSSTYVIKHVMVATNEMEVQERPVRLSKLNQSIREAHLRLTTALNVCNPPIICENCNLTTGLVQFHPDDCKELISKKINSIKKKNSSFARRSF